MLFVAPVVLFDMLKAKQLACVSESGQKCPAARSLSLRRAWIEIVNSPSVWRFEMSRSPYGERGLKSIAPSMVLVEVASLSLRRAWIEMAEWSSFTANAEGRSPYGERGLKL